MKEIVRRGTDVGAAIKDEPGVWGSRCPAISCVHAENLSDDGAVATGTTDRQRGPIPRRVDTEEGWREPAHDGSDRPPHRSFGQEKGRRRLETEVRHMPKMGSNECHCGLHFGDRQGHGHTPPTRERQKKLRGASVSSGVGGVKYARTRGARAEIWRTSLTPLTSSLDDRQAGTYTDRRCSDG